MIKRRDFIRHVSMGSLAVTLDVPLRDAVALQAGFKKPDAVPPIKYIRPDAPVARTPAVEGERYSALVPDTCDLAERARLFLGHYLRAMTVESLDYEPYGRGYLDLDPPRIALSWSDYACSLPKFRESLPLLRIMTGSTEALAIDRIWARRVLESIGPDGLYYTPRVGRPWDNTKIYEWFDNPDAEFYAWLPTSNGRLLGALAVYYEMTGDEGWNRAARAIVDRMWDFTVAVDDQRVFSRFLFYPNETLSRDEIQRTRQTMYTLENQENPGNTPMWQTWIITGLCQYYRASGYEPARELAEGLARYMQATRYVEEWKSHFHCITLGIQALLELSLATGDRRWAEAARQAYEHARSGAMLAIPELGHFANETKKAPVEGCSIGDMIAIAVKLTQLDMGDQYWEHLDQYVRNGFMEIQITSPNQIEQYVRAIGSAGLARRKHLEYTDLADRLPVRLVGNYHSYAYPNDLFSGNGSGEHFFTPCCPGNCSRALYYAWESIVKEARGGLSVNLLLNRASLWADVDSYLPYVGRVDIRMKQAREPVRIRMNEWIDKRQVRCRVGQQARDYRWEGNYINVGRVAGNETIVVEFPIDERPMTVKSFGMEYRLTMKGNTVVDIDPKGEHVPLYQRAHYRSESVRHKRVERFATAETIEW